ncbi:YueH family protein [Macrococcoides caseolyticum]|uniref:YueH family protein n=1 Tax=Macrococcoides caseolyticum TaxID=69966 RepID=UPI001F2C257B|nr:YueH family protein [Macrococcus caseolyticus]MCE4955706.1 hypothetical protein [Macrococcus caseolyticus]
MKIRNYNGEDLQCKVYIHENRKEETILVSVPEIFFSIQIDYDIYGEALVEHIYLHLFNLLDEKEANHLALSIAQWTAET